MYVPNLNDVVFLYLYRSLLSSPRPDHHDPGGRLTALQQSTATCSAQTSDISFTLTHRNGRTERPFFDRLLFVPHPTQRSAITVVIANDHYTFNISITLILFIIIIFNRSHCSFVLFWTPLPPSATLEEKSGKHAH